MKLEEKSDSVVLLYCCSKGETTKSLFSSNFILFRLIAEETCLSVAPTLFCFALPLKKICDFFGTGVVSFGKFLIQLLLLFVFFVILNHFDIQQWRNSEWILIEENKKKLTLCQNNEKWTKIIWNIVFPHLELYPPNPSLTLLHKRTFFQIIKTFF